METNKISRKLLERLPLYLDYLKSMPEGCETVSATIIARGLKMGEVQVRKDLAKVSGEGRKRTGRSRQQVTEDLERFLTCASQTGAIVVGAGELGQTLPEFDNAGINLMADFELHPAAKKRCGTRPIYPISRMESFCRSFAVNVGIIAVPPQSAQAVCDSMIACGIKAIWNLAPVALKTPEHIVVRSGNFGFSRSGEIA